MHEFFRAKYEIATFSCVWVSNFWQTIIGISSMKSRLNYQYHILQNTIGLEIIDTLVQIYKIT